MKDKNLPPDNNSQSLEDLTKEANSIMESLEAQKNLENSTNSYQELLKLNKAIEKKFKNNAIKITEETRDKIKNITSKKNAK